MNNPKQRLLLNKNSLYKAIEIIAYFLLFLFFTRIVVQFFVNGPDYNTHMKNAYKYMAGDFYIPHPAYHIITYSLAKITTIPYQHIVPVFMAAIIVFTIFLTKIILARLSPAVNNPMFYLFFAIVINLVIAIYIPMDYHGYVTGPENPNIWRRPDRVFILGTGSPNMWASPTMNLLRPFALLGFLGVAALFRKDRRPTREITILTSLVLLISTWVKPSFIICLLPAAGLYLLLPRFKDRRMFFTMLWVFLPSVLLLIYQYAETYLMKDTNSYFHDKIIFSWFGVAKIYTKSVFISTLRVLAFPLLVLVFSYKNIRQNSGLLLGWLLLIISFIFYGVLAEQNKYEQGAFCFSFYVCLFILFVFSLGEYLQWFTAIKKNKIKISVAGLVLFCHLISGIVYLQGLLFDGRLWR